MCSEVFQLAGARSSSQLTATGTIPCLSCLLWGEASGMGKPISWQAKVWIVLSKQDTGYMEGHGQTSPSQHRSVSCPCSARTVTLPEGVTHPEAVMLMEG